MNVNEAGITGRGNVFGLKGSVDAELSSYKLLVKDDPARSKHIYSIGEQLIEYAAKGEYNQFKRLTSTLTADDVLSYFIAKALLASLIGNHLMLSVFILDQGYPIRIDRGLPNILHECLQVCLDYQCASIVSFLHSKGVDINKQAKGSYFAPIHVAVERCLLDTARLLLELGADVNAVALNDVMPLNLAYALADSSDGYKQDMVNLLIKSGAKDTWRRDNALDNGLYAYEITTSTQIKAAPHSNSIEVGSSYPLGNNKVRFSGAQLSQDLHVFQGLSGLSSAASTLDAIEAQSIAADSSSSNSVPSTQPDLSDDGAFLFST